VDPVKVERENQSPVSEGSSILQLERVPNASVNICTQKTSPQLDGVVEGEVSRAIVFRNRPRLQNWTCITAILPYCPAGASTTARGDWMAFEGIVKSFDNLSECVEFVKRERSGLCLEPTPPCINRQASLTGAGQFGFA